MAKVSKSESKGVDLSKLLPDLSSLGEPTGSCLGLEFDANAPECKQCADAALCLAFFKFKIQVKINDLLPNTPFLDMVDFSLVTDEVQQKMVNLVQKYQSEGTPMQVGELVNAVKGISKCSDDYAVLEWFKRFMRDNNLTTSNGQITKR